MTRTKPQIFLGIGAQKSATKWLYRCLPYHADVMMTSVKEMHFFDRVENQNLSLLQRII